jgi:methionine biosynthesis protein MetW
MASCCNYWRAAASTAAASSCRARASTAASPRVSRWCQGDADTDLVNYPDDAFDYVILSQTLQATRQPKVVLENLLRIGRRAVVSFPNFGFWKMRLQLLVGGHMPRTENLPATWYDTPNIHFCTIKDFVQLCDEINVKMERAVALDLYGRPVPLTLPWWVWNMFGEQGVFLLSRGGTGK